MSLRSNLQNVQNRAALDPFDHVDFADVSDTEIPRLAALITSLAVNVVLTALLLRSCLQKSRSFSNGALFAMPCRYPFLSSYFGGCCKGYTIIKLLYIYIKDHTYYTEPLWRSLEFKSGESLPQVILQWLEHRVTVEQGIGSCLCCGTAQRMAVYNAYCILLYPLHCWEKKGVDVVWWSRELYGVVLFLITTLGIDGNRIIFSDFVLVPFSSRAFDIRQRARHQTCEGVAESFDTSEAVQWPQYFASSWNHGTKCEVLGFEALLSCCSTTTCFLTTQSMLIILELMLGLTPICSMLQTCHTTRLRDTAILCDSPTQWPLRRAFSPLSSASHGREEDAKDHQRSGCARSWSPGSCNLHAGGKSEGMVRKR